jgi:hypothetical protein
MKRTTQILVLLALSAFIASPAIADSFTFTTGSPNGTIAVASRPANGSQIEIETADDFLLTSHTLITGATFTGLLPSGASVNQVIVEIYQVFPNSSTNPPDGRVPTRVNSPSDVDFASRISGSNLTFTTTTLSSSFTAANSVLNGINPIPNQTTGGEGPVTGMEVQFMTSFSSPFDLPSDHYFFVAQVGLSNGDFYWLSAAKPNVIDPFAGDLQTWVRNSNLDPDWLRVGTDIVGGATPPTYNMSFSLTGTTVPEPSSSLLLVMGIVGLAGLRWKANRALGRAA